MCLCLLDNTSPVLVFETKSGDLAVRKHGDGYIMDFPLYPPSKEVRLSLDAYLLYVKKLNACCWISRLNKV